MSLTTQHVLEEVVMEGHEYRSYDSAFKLNAVNLAEATSKQAATRKFVVDRKRIQEWCKQKQKLNELAAKKVKVGNTGRYWCIEFCSF